MKQRRSFAARLRHIAIARVKLPDPKVTGDEAAHALFPLCLATVMDQFKMLTKMPEMAPSRVQGELYG